VKRPQAAALALAAAACWAFAAVAAKDVFSAVPPARLAQLRAASTAVLLLGGLAVFGADFAITQRAVGAVVVFGACLALVNGSYYLAIRRLPVGVALTIQYTGPLMVLVVRRHRVPWRLWMAAAAAVAGAALGSGVTGGGGVSSTGLGLAFVSALGFAGYLLSGEVVARHVGAVQSVAFGFAAASVWWALIQPWWTFPFGRVTGWHAGVRVAVVVLGGTLVPFVCMVIALRTLSAGPAGVLATAEPAFGAVFAWLLLSEALRPVQVLGLVLVVAGVAAVQAREVGWRRMRFFSDWCRFASRRRRSAPADGAVGRRARCTARAPARRSRSRSSAFSRLRAWERSSEATTRTTGPSLSSRRALCRGPSAMDEATSKRTSALVFEVLACWPPGPPDALNLHSNSSNGMEQVRVTRKTPPGPVTSAPSG